MECLIIDDDLDDQEIFLLILNNVNPAIKCFTADNGLEGLQLLEEKIDFIPKYIFIDINMPKMNGIDCLQKIKAIQRLKNSKIFMYSTTMDTKAFEKSKAMGATDFIVKPTRPADLKNVLTKILMA